MLSFFKHKTFPKHNFCKHDQISIVIVKDVLHRDYLATKIHATPIVKPNPHYCLEQGTNAQEGLLPSHRGSC